LFVFQLDDGLEFTAKPRHKDGLHKSSSMEFMQQLEDDAEQQGKNCKSIEKVQC
jgi:hypothetical protein